MLNWIFVFLALSSFIFGASPLKVEVAAKGAILMNAETGAVLWEKNAHSQLFPASTTKLVIALYAMEKKGEALDEMVTASEDAVYYVAPQIRRASSQQHPPYRLEFGGSHMSIKPGEVLSLRTLIYGLMLASGNDAANVIAQYVSGNIPDFMNEVNAFVRAKGCCNTFFCTPHGLPHDDHKTTAYDMAILAREFLKHSWLCEVVKTQQFTRPQTNKQPAGVLNQHNALVMPGKFFYPKAIGIKTGYTLASGHTLVCAAENTERKLIAVLLGCDSLEQRYKEAIALFESGFNEKKASRTLFSQGFDLFSCDVKGGRQALQAFLKEDAILEYYPSEEPVFTTSVKWDEIFLPILSGQKVGEVLAISASGQVLLAKPIFATKNIDPTLSYRIQGLGIAIKHGLSNHLTLVVSLSGIFVIIITFIYSERRRKVR